ncbi:MAG: hypothetical protein QXL94_00715, partial [Candidatus Parvarchaeum sp.]
GSKRSDCKRNICPMQILIIATFARRNNCPMQQSQAQHLFIATIARDNNCPAQQLPNANINYRNICKRI